MVFQQLLRLNVVFSMLRSHELHNANSLGATLEQGSTCTAYARLKGSLTHPKVFQVKVTGVQPRLEGEVLLSYRSVLVQAKEAVHNITQ